MRAQTLGYVLAGAALLWWLTSRAQVGGAMDVRFPSGMGDDPEADTFTGDIPDWDILPSPTGAPDMRDESLILEPQVAAFLYMIRRAEHQARDVETGADYLTFYGGSRFSDTSDHPVMTGEKRGVRLSPAQCRAAGYPGGVCVSTAAGAYQITRPTWGEVRNESPRLESFSPEDQDRAAVRLLRRAGVLDRLAAGDVFGAINLASRKWASLPGSTAQQNPKTLAQVLAFFDAGGGSVNGTLA